jgi:hypothetical protein
MEYGNGSYQSRDFTYHCIHTDINGHVDPFQCVKVGIVCVFRQIRLAVTETV